ncbi:MAG: hypothetical protein AAF206_20965 [Bacteroidota bacterium]
MRKVFLWTFSLVLLSMAVISSSCNRFEDGPGISFQSAVNRISNTWRVKEAALNGADITPQFESDFFTFDDNGVFETLDAARLIHLPPYTQDTIIPTKGEGEWDFVDRSHIEILYNYRFRDPYNTSVNYVDERYEFWEVTRLSADELWLRNDSVLMKMEFFNE